MLKLIGVICICLHSINCFSGNDSLISEISSNYTFDLSYSNNFKKASAYDKSLVKVFKHQNVSDK